MKSKNKIKKTQDIISRDTFSCLTLFTNIAIINFIQNDKLEKNKQTNYSMRSCNFKLSKFNYLPNKKENKSGIIQI